MKNKRIKKLIILATTLSLSYCLTGCNWNNTVGDIEYEEKAIDWFEDTDIVVKENNNNLVYHIVKDKNGWLYYIKEPSGILEPVIDAEGNRTKDISIFLEDN